MIILPVSKPVLSLFPGAEATSESAILAKVGIAAMVTQFVMDAPAAAPIVLAI